MGLWFAGMSVKTCGGINTAQRIFGYGREQHGFAARRVSFVSISPTNAWFVPRTIHPSD
jgi:hypothetical protein